MLPCGMFMCAHERQSNSLTLKAAGSQQQRVCSTRFYYFVAFIADFFLGALNLFCKSELIVLSHNVPLAMAS